MDVEYIPAKPQRYLKRSVLYCLISYIPEGTIITERMLEEFLRNYYQDDRIQIYGRGFDFHTSVMMNSTNCVPVWRFLSTRGYVQEVYISRDSAREKLRSEGHEVDDKYRVRDYKETAAALPCPGWGEALTDDVFEKDFC